MNDATKHPVFIPTAQLKIGQRVYDLHHGWGVVAKLNKTTYRIRRDGWEDVENYKGHLARNATTGEHRTEKHG